MPGFGEILREARSNRGVSLEEVEKATRIRKKYLKALEEEDFAHLPDQLYVRGFTRLYAQYLGLNPQEMLTLLPRDPRRKPMQPLPNMKGDPVPIGSWIIGIAIFCVMGLGGYYLYQFQRTETPLVEGQVVKLPTATPTITPTPRPWRTPTPARTKATATPTTETIGVASPESGTARLPGTPTHPPTSTPVEEATPTAVKPVQVQVPAVIGMSYDEAAKVITSAGLALARNDDWNDTVPAGSVFSQNPNAGSLVDPTAMVSVLVSKGRQTTKVTVPNVVGMPEAQGIRVLQGANLTVSPWVNRQGHKEVPAKDLERVSVGAVLSTMPGPGSQVDPGTTINIAVRAD